MSEWGLPQLRADRLATIIPAQVYGGGPVAEPATMLFIWHTASLNKARGMTVAFYVDDTRFEALWRTPRHYIALFLRHGIAALIEPDFSLWADAPLVEQLYNVFRMRTLGRVWQDAGLSVIPNLAWSDERSFPFCFTGIPSGAPVVACECRTAGGNDEDRRAFLRGLIEGVKQVKPQHVCIYGGKEHAFWLTDHLPKGPQYTLVASWTAVRRRRRATQERQTSERNQLNLFTGGEAWADVEAGAAPA
jgi:hypothetical protein